MGFLDIFRRPAPAAAGAGAKSSATGALFAWNTPPAARWTPRRFDRLAEEGYRRNVIAYRCVRVIAQGAASARWLLYGPGAKEFSSHPVLALLARPNPLQGGAALLENLFGYYLIAGNAYLEAAGPDGQAPRELYALRPDRMKIVPGSAGLPAGYDYTVDGRKLSFPADPLNGRSAILHLKTFNPLDDWYGLSPLEAAAYAIDQHNAAGAWNQSLLQNAARPSGALVYAPKEGPAALSETQFERLKAEIERHYTGAANAGRPLLLEGGLQWTEMSISPKDMDFIASKLQSARDVAAAYGVPPMLVGVPGDATYANFREARLALWEDTILPLLDFVVDQLNNWLCPRFGDGLRLAVDVDEVSALGPRREAAWSRVQGADFLTTNEKRAAVGYAPLKGGDDLGLQRLPGPPLGRIDSRGTAGIDTRFDPNQPRLPAGDPAGGQWTDGGGGGGGSDGGDSGGSDASGDDSGGDEPKPPPKRPVSPSFIDEIAKRESGGQPDGGYGARSGDALGRYQLKTDAQKDVGLRDSAGKWNPKNKYGVANEAEFLANHKAQDDAFADYLEKNDAALGRVEPETGVRPTDHVGQEIDGVLAQSQPENYKPFKVTTGGLAAASHRRGVRGVARYLNHQKNNNWRSDFRTVGEGGDLSKERAAAHTEVETRLREFEKVPYRE